MATNKFTIEIVKGPKDPQAFVFTQKAIHIGSMYAQNDLILNVEGISARHARIRRNKEDFDIHNLSDTPFAIGEGISLESQKTVKVRPGTQVDMGAVAIRLIHGPAHDSSGNEKKKPQPIPNRHGLSRLVANMPRIRRATVIGGVAVLFFLVAIMAGNCVKKERKSNNASQVYPAAASQEPIALPAKGIYGYTQNNDKDHPDKAVFTFETDASNVELYYTAGGIDSEQEVTIHLNGQHIGYAPLAKGVWGPETVLRLPKEALKKGVVNQLIFDNIENPPKFDQWAVRNLRIETLADNLCDVDKAAKLIELGQEMYAQKSISKGNLYLAYRYYRDAVAYMQDCSKKEDIFKKAQIKQEQTGQELDTLYHDFSFAFQKAYKMNDLDQCQSILENVVLYFPDPLDKRYQEAAGILEKYSQN